MTFFTFIWFLIVVCCFIQKSITYMFFVTLLFMTFQCDNVIELDQISVGPQILTSLLLIVKAFISKRGEIAYRRGFGRIILMLAFVLAAVIASCLYNRVFDREFLKILQLAVYMACFCAIFFMSDNIGSEQFYGMIRSIIIFLVVVGAVQFLTNINLLPFRSLLKVLFYNDDSPVVYFNTDYYGRIMSTYMEPSYFAGFIVGAFYFLASFQKKWRENIWLFVVLFIELIFTVSSTAYIAFAIIGVLFLMLQSDISIKTKVGIIVLAIIGTAVVYFVFYERLDAAIFSKKDSGSYFQRIHLNALALKNFASSVWFGVGYKESRASSIIYCLLGETGLLGLATYFLLNIKLILPTFFRKRPYATFHIGITFALLSAVACQIIACPDLDLCTYWFWAYCFAHSFKNRYEFDSSSDTDAIPFGTADVMEKRHLRRTL